MDIIERLRDLRGNYIGDEQLQSLRDAIDFALTPFGFPTERKGE